MSMPRKVRVSCPKCKASLDATVWDSVNTDISSDLPQKIISGEFFEHTCSNCGFVFQIEYPTLYHDMKHGAMIWIVHQDEKYESNVKDVRESVKLFPGYLTRIVHNVPELREKVCIIEAGRDDRVIEFIKLLFAGQLDEECPDFCIDRVFYRSAGQQEYVEFYDSEGNSKHCVLDEDTYQEFAYLLKPILTEEPIPRFAVVDYRWAANLMDKFDLHLENEAAKEGLTVEQLIAQREATQKNEVLKQEMQDAEVNHAAQHQNITPRFCRECGERLMENSKFCHKCGTAVLMPQVRSTEPKRPMPTPTSNAPSNPTSTPPKCDTKPMRKKLRCILPIIIALAIVGGIIWGTQSYWKAAFLYDIKINGSHEITLHIGNSHEVSYSAEIGDLSADDIEWKSSDTSVATVSGSGVIRAKGEGQATITVSINGVEKDSCTVKVTLRTIPVKNGEMIKRPRRTDYPEVTINAPSNANCFVYFKNISNSAYDFAFYVKAGSSATVNAPTGTYAFYYASGEEWYGPDLKFGRGTSFFKAPDLITLTEDDSSYDVLELTLYAVPNGNMDTDPIDASEFPM